jgi:hypothetical protein
MSSEFAGWSELSELMADHVLGYENRNVRLAVVDCYGTSDEFRWNSAIAGPGLDNCPVLFA